MDLVAGAANSMKYKMLMAGNWNCKVVILDSGRDRGPGIEVVKFEELAAEEIKDNRQNSNQEVPPRMLEVVPFLDGERRDIPGR